VSELPILAQEKMVTCSPIGFFSGGMNIAHSMIRGILNLVKFCIMKSKLNIYSLVALFFLFPSFALADSAEIILNVDGVEYTDSIPLNFGDSGAASFSIGMGGSEQFTLDLTMGLQSTVAAQGNLALESVVDFHNISEETQSISLVVKLPHPYLIKSPVVTGGMQVVLIMDEDGGIISTNTQPNIPLWKIIFPGDLKKHMFYGLVMGGSGAGHAQTTTSFSGAQAYVPPSDLSKDISLAHVFNLTSGDRAKMTSSAAISGNVQNTALPDSDSDSGENHDSGGNDNDSGEEDHNSGGDDNDDSKEVDPEPTLDPSDEQAGIHVQRLRPRLARVEVEAGDAGQYTLRVRAPGLRCGGPRGRVADFILPTGADTELDLRFGRQFLGKRARVILRHDGARVAGAGVNIGPRGALARRNLIRRQNLIRRPNRCVARVAN